MPAFWVAVMVLSFDLAIILDIQLGNHDWSEDVVHRQVLGLLVFVLGVLIPTIVLAAGTRSFWTIFASSALAVVLIIVFKFFEHGYRKRLSDLEFLDMYQEGADWYPVPRNLPRRKRRVQGLWR